jgi:NAD(P)-dependent dehydrogenase (short-subunit alcohol dehydrogenase family)
MASSRISLENRIAIVTGAGAGLGRSHAMALAKHGAKVVVNDLGSNLDGIGADAGPAAKVVAEIKAAGGEAVANTDSAATKEGARQIVQTALDTFGRIDIIMNNAGINRPGWFTEQTEEDLEATLAVHTKGPFFICQEAFESMKKQNYGRLIFTTSSGGLYGHAQGASYGIAKAGVFGLANVLGLEGARYNITSNCISPYAFTRMTDELLTDKLKQRLDPSYISPLVVYLASEECKLTQHVFAVGGGSIALTFVATTNGWQSREPIRAEAVREHIEIICDEKAGFAIPHSTDEDSIQLLKRR